MSTSSLEATSTRIPRPVWLLGFVSLFTDAATEIIYPLMPVYLSRVLGASALSLGVIEGVAEGVNSLLKLMSGWWSDRQTKRRPIVIAGYALSSAARPLIAIAGTWMHVLLIRVVDRTGKGIRSAPRDAMLTRLADASSRGRIFGFHRAMDHTGAIVGPLLATMFLFFLPGQYRLLFALTAIPGALAVSTLFLVKEPEPELPELPELRELRPSEPLPTRLYAVLGIILLFSLGNSADAFLLLRLADALGTATYVPLLWAGLHVVKASLSTWGGSLSDRIGRVRVIAMGWAIYALVYLGFALSASAHAYVALFLVYGVHFALAEGAEKALVADLTPSRQQGTAFGLYNAALGVGALIASIAFGYLYQRFGPATAFGSGAALAGLAAVLLLIVSGTGNLERRTHPF
jgi:MFS family permease